MPRKENALLGHVSGTASLAELADKQIAEGPQMSGQLFSPDSLQNLAIRGVGCIIKDKVFKSNLI